MGRLLLEGSGNMAKETLNPLRKTRWGILSTGGIAHKFARSALNIPGASLVAVGSRTQEAADTFGEEFHIPHRHASYEALASDPEVDIIYIATPHNFHYANARLCLEAGKPALVEKAFTLNAPQAADLIALSRQKRLFLMEAMWSRFLPCMVKVRQLVQSGVIGELRMVKADLCFRAEYRPEWRLLNPNLAGGALLDVGCYVVSFASMLLGNPTQVSGMSFIGQTGPPRGAHGSAQLRRAHRRPARCLGPGHRRLASPGPAVCLDAAHHPQNRAWNRGAFRL